MNFPSTLGCNWQWRLKKGQMGKTLSKKLYQLTERTNRL
jgi:4-alpha-glucanotransferase